MSYTTPVTDRTISDVENGTSKGYFNEADWDRIYNNSQLVNTEVVSKFEEPITFNTVTTPDTSTSPTNLVDTLNTILANIERLRVFLIPYLTLTEIKDDWERGKGSVAPNYEDANLWESVLDSIHTNFDNVGLRRPRCGVAVCGTGMTRNNMFRRT